MQDLRPFFAEKHFIETKQEGAYQPLQWGANISCFIDNNFDWDDADIILLGCNEQRGADADVKYQNSADAIREQLYALYTWHPSIKIADAGNIRQGETLEDSRAALRTVLHELQLAGKTVIVIGGSHDLTLEQYNAYKKSKKMIKAAVADMLVDLDETEAITDRSFLMDMLTLQPNFVQHYSHIGFQSYYAHPRMMETLDKLRFDFFRLGKVREHLEDMEPVLRASDLFSFDLSAVRYPDAIINSNGSPNGFTGEEACLLSRYAGMSNQLTSYGIYGYNSSKDINDMTAKLIAQMIWYFIDGYQVSKTEALLSDIEDFVTFHISFTDNDTVFIKSKRTNRWWMKMPDQTYVPCAYNDYLMASNDEIPERWLREQERLI